MYDNNELDQFKAKIISKSAFEIVKEDKDEDKNWKKLSVQEMHDEFVALMIDTFNLHSYDPDLRQLIVLLIARYHSERAEFVRNLDRTLLFFEESDYLFYCWLQQQLDKFIFNSEKSNVWLLEIKTKISQFNESVIDDIPVCKELDDLLVVLKELKWALIYTCEVKENHEPEGDQYTIKHNKGTRKISFYAQNLFRNVKVYDYLINFLFQNRELLMNVRSISEEGLDEERKQIVTSVKKVFKKIFRILEYMTTKNAKTQELMWKYKEDFVFEELGHLEQDGELELVLAIIDDSDSAIKYHQNKWTLSKTRQFVNSLHQRIKGEENFVLILEIYNKLIKFEAISFLKQSLTKLIMSQPADIHSYDKENRRDFEKAQNLQEIIYSIIYDQEKIFTRDFLSHHFPLKDCFTEIDLSIENLNQIEMNDDKYDEQDFDELRDYQYLDLLKIYMQLYFHEKYSKITKAELEECMTILTPVYVRKLNDFNNISDFENPGSIRASTMRYLMIYLRSFFQRMERQYKVVAEREINSRTNATMSFNHQNPLSANRNLGGGFETLKAKKQEIEELTDEIFRRMEEADEDKYREVIEELNEFEETEVTSSNFGSKSNQVRTTKILKRGVTLEEKTRSNARSRKSHIFTTIWRNYVRTISRKRSSRILVDKEHLQLANLMFKTLTDKNSHQLLIQSYKTFISTSIDYVFSCEKANWTLYIIVFIFKINSMLLKL